jgi:hypothetical protein
MSPNYMARKLAARLGRKGTTAQSLRSLSRGFNVQNVNFGRRTLDLRINSRILAIDCGTVSARRAGGGPCHSVSTEILTSVRYVKGMRGQLSTLFEHSRKYTLEMRS